VISPETGAQAPPDAEARRRSVLALPAPVPSDWLRPTASRLPFPFGDDRTEYLYFGRNAVYHAALRLGLAGREVLVPAYHHGVEVEALVAAGARPVFYRIDAAMRADPADVRARITHDTGAIYVIHYAGFPQPMDELCAPARSRGLAIVEDCALSLLSADGDRPLGQRGDAAVFCLYKTLAVPDGGTLWMPSGPAAPTVRRAPPAAATAHIYASALMAGWEARGIAPARRVRSAMRILARPLRRVPIAGRRLPTGTRHFDPRAADVAISRVSLHLARTADHAAIVARRRSNYEQLRAELGDDAPPVTGALPQGVCPLFYPLRRADKAVVREKLARQGVETIDFWRGGSPLLPHGAFPETEALRREVLEIPVHQDLSPADVDALAQAVRRAVE